MTGDRTVPAAQYLRMSTEHQQYSLENQIAMILRYAEAHGFVVAQTYSDAARSGVVLRQRPGLRQLLQDVVAGTAVFKAILVYDVSRWGRFQDADESAHYEFVCKSAGVPIHYCAEPFANDGSMPSLIMKALKRTMAGEFSRELGVKVLAGQQRLARLGFKQGGLPGYGLRRMLVTGDRKPKQLLALRERKSIATDRVILVPGPRKEVDTVREIFRMLIEERPSECAIARELNRRGIKYLEESSWDNQAVHEVLTNPKYAGCHVLGRTTSKLSTPSLRVPRSEWIFTPGAFEPIVDTATFEAANKILGERTIHKSDEQLLQDLKFLLASEGRLTFRLITKSRVTPSPSTYRKRFGGLRKAYELIGYGRPQDFGGIDMRRRTRALRDELMSKITALFPHSFLVVRRGGRWRPKLYCSSGPRIAVLIARAFVRSKGGISWRVDPNPEERNDIALVARLDKENAEIFAMHLFARIERTRSFYTHEDDGWLTKGVKLNGLSKLMKIASRLRSRRSRRF